MTIREPACESKKPYPVAPGVEQYADCVPEAWESLEPMYCDFDVEVPLPKVEQFWMQVMDFCVEKIYLRNLGCSGAKYAIVPELSAL